MDKRLVYFGPTTSTQESVSPTGILYFRLMLTFRKCSLGASKDGEQEQNNQVLGTAKDDGR
jgi:hypothetical protein